MNVQERRISIARKKIEDLGEYSYDKVKAILEDVVRPQPQIWVCRFVTFDGIYRTVCIEEEYRDVAIEYLKRLERPSEIFSVYAFDPDRDKLPTKMYTEKDTELYSELLF